MIKDIENGKVAIVIPTFNRAKTVTKTIDTALEQTHPCQVIVCDHGSKDNTSEVMKKYGDKITYIRREKDFGPHFCWLEGVLNADAEFVHVHFDDDFMMPTYIEECMKMMDQDLGMVITEASEYNWGKKEVARKNILGLKKFFNDGVNDIKKLETGILEKKMMFSPAACLYRRKDFIDALYQGSLPIDFGGEYHGVGPDHFVTLLIVLRYKKFGVILKPLSVFGFHDGSITIDASKDKEKSKKLADGYQAVRYYYMLLALYKNHAMIRNWIQRSKIKKSFSRNMKLFLKKVGLRKKKVK